LEIPLPVSPGLCIFSESSCHNELDGRIAVNKQTADKWLIAARRERFNIGQKIAVDVM